MKNKSAIDYDLIWSKIGCLDDAIATQEKQKTDKLILMIVACIMFAFLSVTILILRSFL